MTLDFYFFTDAIIAISTKAPSPISDTSTKFLAGGFSMQNILQKLY